MGIDDSGDDLPILRSGGTRLRRLFPRTSGRTPGRAAWTCQSGTLASTASPGLLVHRLEHRHRPVLSLALVGRKRGQLPRDGYPSLARARMLAQSLSPSRRARQTPAGRSGGGRTNPWVHVDATTRVESRATQPLLAASHASARWALDAKPNLAARPPAVFE